MTLSYFLRFDSFFDFCFPFRQFLLFFMICNSCESVAFRTHHSHHPLMLYLTFHPDLHRFSLAACLFPLICYGHILFFSSTYVFLIDFPKIFSSRCFCQPMVHPLYHAIFISSQFIRHQIRYIPLLMIIRSVSFPSQTYPLLVGIPNIKIEMSTTRYFTHVNPFIHISFRTYSRGFHLCYLYVA